MGKKAGKVKATATTTVLPVEGSNPKFETSIEGNGIFLSNIGGRQVGPGKPNQRVPSSDKNLTLLFFSRQEPPSNRKYRA